MSFVGKMRDVLIKMPGSAVLPRAHRAFSHRKGRVAENVGVTLDVIRLVGVSFLMVLFCCLPVNAPV
jgi:hypothetical protein